MRQLIVSEFVTLDGVMEAPGGEPTHPFTGWVMDYESEEQITYKFEEIVDVETLLIGRVTYESFAGAWPNYQGEFADKMNSMQKVVVSNTLQDPEWNNTMVLEGDAVAGITTLKARDGGPILVAGSTTLVHTLLDHDLVDTLRLMVFPVTIGAGARLFSDTHKKSAWTLIDSFTLASGVRTDTYQPA
jgi:dihydrofolate reductase